MNRAVLSWVKQWDYCVFNKPIKKKYLMSETRQNRTFPTKKDALQRPFHRILLLSGPPGLGKTTLAHVIAQHAGYNVVEINARFLYFSNTKSHGYSDDRTGDALKNKILGAIECQEVYGNRKPNLIIIDEIDGASTTGSGEMARFFTFRNPSQVCRTL